MSDVQASEHPVPCVFLEDEKFVEKIVASSPSCRTSTTLVLSAGEAEILRSLVKGR